MIRLGLESLVDGLVRPRGGAGGGQADAHRTPCTRCGRGRGDVFMPIRWGELDRIRPEDLAFGCRVQGWGLLASGWAGVWILVPADSSCGDPSDAGRLAECPRRLYTSRQQARDPGML